MCKDALTEILHTILLGLVKYLWRHLIDKVKNKPKDSERLGRTIKALSTDGLGFPHIDGSRYVRFHRSLCGTDFRKIIQIGPHVVGVK
jgi:hypothetical protein